MTSFVNGMATLPTALANSLQEQCDLRYDQEVTGIQQEQDSWVVETTSTQFRCEHVVTAVPVNTSLQLLKGTSNLPPAPLQKIPEARLAVILLGFDKDAEIPFGFGYLAPEKEERFSLGALFSSHMFPGRAPAGHQLVEVLVGGRRHGDKLKLDDKNLINEAYRDLRSLMHLPKAPCFSTVLRPQAGIPQLEAGYTDLLDWRNRIQQTYPNFHICGFGWNGIGINDMTKEAEKTAERILAGQLENDAAEVKGIYF